MMLLPAQHVQAEADQIDLPQELTHPPLHHGVERMMCGFHRLCRHHVLFQQHRDIAYRSIGLDPERPQIEIQRLEVEDEPAGGRIDRAVSALFDRTAEITLAILIEHKLRLAGQEPAVIGLPPAALNRV